MRFRDELAFRDLLRRSTETAGRDAELKRDLVARFDCTLKLSTAGKPRDRLARLRLDLVHGAGRPQNIADSAIGWTLNRWRRGGSTATDVAQRGHDDRLGRCP